MRSTRSLRRRGARDDVGVTLRRRARSIRARVVSGYIALLAFALVTTLVVVWAALTARFHNDVDRRLAEEVDQLAAVIAEGERDTGSGFTDAEVLFETHLRRVLPGDDDAFYTLVEGEGFLFSFDPPAELLDDPDLVDEFAAVDASTYRTIDTEAGSARLLIVPVGLAENNGTFVAAAFTERARSEITDLFRLVALVAVVVVVATGLVAAAVASRVTRPIRDLTELARSITDADLSARIPPDPGADREIVELSDTFNAMLARLETGFVAHRRFLDDVAHELRTPITIVQGHLEFLEDDPVERASTVALVTDELARMNRYVDDLLVLAQAEQPDFVRIDDVDLSSFFDSLMDRVPALGDRSWTVDARDDGWARFDRQRVTQAILNLCQNAVRHTDLGDEIGLGISSNDGLVSFAVRDTGSGIDPEIVDQLFERHARSAASRSGGGIGLGLSIVDAIAVAHGGRVTGESAPGRGATFTIELPTGTTDQ